MKKSYNQYYKEAKSFEGEMLKRVRVDLKKADITSKDLKGMWTHAEKYGARKNYEVQIPKNEKFVNGLYIHVGQADSAADAKTKALEMLERNIKNLDEIIKTGKIL